MPLSFPSSFPSPFPLPFPSLLSATVSMVFSAFVPVAVREIEVSVAALVAESRSSSNFDRFTYLDCSRRLPRLSQNDFSVCSADSSNFPAYTSLRSQMMDLGSRRRRHFHIWLGSSPMPHHRLLCTWKVRGNFMTIRVLSYLQFLGSLIWSRWLETNRSPFKHFDSVI